VYLTEKKKRKKKFCTVPKKRKGKEKKNCIPLWGDFLLFLRKTKKRRGNFVMRRFCTVPEKRKEK
jgi:hypothetical protein